MFCGSCGAKMPDGARFCARCGAAAPAAAPHSAAPEPPRGGLRSSIVEFRRTALRAVPTFVLAIVAFLAAAGAAYAAYRVATEVIIPAIERAVGADQGATGHPESFLQLAEIAAMDPGDVPAYLEEQGLGYVEPFAPGTAPGTGEDNPPMYGQESNTYSPTGSIASWEADGNGILLQEAGIPQRYLSDSSAVGAGQDKIELVMGDNLSDTEMTPPENYTYATVESLKKGETPHQFVLSGLRLSWLGEEGANAVAKAAGFGSVAGAYTCVWSASSRTEAAYTGFIRVKGKDYAWSIQQGTRIDGKVGTVQLRCFALADVKRTVITEQKLYSEAEWKAASEKQRAEMFAQAIVQESRESHDGGVSLNLRTGQLEGAPENITGTGPSYLQYDGVTEDSIKDFTRE